MSVSSLEDIWEAICEICKNQISEVAFETFLSKLKPISFSSGNFIVSHENEYMAGVIEDNYGELMKSALSQVMGLSDVKVSVIFEDESKEIENEENINASLNFEDFFTFNNFIVGSTNRFAQAASFAVADNPNIIYNPFIIYGPSGVGKTHLMLAIKNHINKKFPQKRVEYVRSESFTNELIQSLQGGTLGIGNINDFRNKYRNADVLLIDDIHFIAGKEQTQEEFFNTFNALHQNNKQIVVTLDRPPRDVKTLDDRIRSRFESGLFADITPPDFETRVGIIIKKSEQLGIELNPNITYYIAEHIKTNTRQIEGVVKKLQAIIQIQNKVPTIAMVQNLIKEVANDTQPEPIKIEKIIAEVARTYNISEAEIVSNRKTASLVLARQVAMYIARETTDLSYKAIGEYFGRDHSTVLHNCSKIEEFLKDKPFQRELVDDIIKNLQSSNEL